MDCHQLEKQNLRHLQTGVTCLEYTPWLLKNPIDRAQEKHEFLSLTPHLVRANGVIHLIG